MMYLEKQTAIELAEWLGYTIDSLGESDRIFIKEFDEDAWLSTGFFFTFERMALLALEHELTVALNEFGVRVDSFSALVHEKHNGSLEDKQRAYCMAVAKVLIGINRSGE